MSRFLERSLARLKRALEATPANGHLWLQVAEICRELGQDDEALSSAKRAAEVLGDSEEREEAIAMIDALKPVPEPVEEPASDDEASDVDEDEPGKLRVLRGGAAPPEPSGDLLTLPERETVNFDDVGGLEVIKEQIRMKIVLPFQKPEIFRAYGKKRGGGILMYGPPGCGKTLLARATAGECRATFMNVSIDSVLDMWYGESERKLAALFDEARRKAPTVLFFDELEAIGGSRQQLRNGPGKTLVNVLLSQMDGVGSSNDRILVMAATNAPWHVDNALLRPGRFDRVQFVPPPDGPARKAILELHSAERPLSKDVRFDDLAKRSKGYSGADLWDLVERAVEAPLKEALKTGELRPLRHKDFKGALSAGRATTKDWFATARNYATFANVGGLYDDLVTYLDKQR